MIDPAFFRALQQHLPQIRQVEIQPKRGWHHNELTRFRYDVMLQVGGEVPVLAEPPWLDWEQVGSVGGGDGSGCGKASRRWWACRGCRVRRLQAEVKAVGLLASPEGPGTVGELREAVGRWRRGGGAGGPVGGGGGVAL